MGQNRVQNETHTDVANWSLTKKQSQINGERTIFDFKPWHWNNCTRELYMQKNKPGHITYTMQKINSKWIIYLRIKCKTTKLLEENLQDLDLAMDFNNLTLKAQSTQGGKKWLNVTLLKLKTSALWKTLLRDWKKKKSSHMLVENTGQKKKSLMKRLVSKI